MVYRHTLILFLLLYLLRGTNTSLAQSMPDTLGEFVPRSQALFEDDFSTSISDVFPLHWSISPCDAPAYRSEEYCHVRNIDGHHALVIQAHDVPFGNIIGNYISPVLLAKDYLPDSFTIQFDFLMGSDAAVPELLLSYTSKCFLLPFMLYNKDNEGGIFEANIPEDNDSLLLQKERTYMKMTSGSFNYKVWHTFALSFDHGVINSYIDNSRVWGINNCHCNPYAMALSARGTDSVAYTNFLSRTGDKPRIAFAGKRFTTHAIHFDVNKSVIKPESIGFIKDVAIWLQQNSSIKLEINGHTDNDGDTNANKKLSRDRADAVKKQLMQYGIDSTRLTTKGYGAEQPLKFNTTQEGKMENRRVEFIKQ
jgi:OOP family OmpA-OmpF porin